MQKELIIIKSASLATAPIDCDKHDYIEIACLHHYKLNIDLKNGDRISVKAVTTKTAEDKSEYFIVETKSAIIEISMTELAKINVVSQNASFKNVVF